MRLPWGAVVALCVVLAASIALPIVIYNSVMEDGRQYARSEFEKMYTVRGEVARGCMCLFWLPFFFVGCVWVCRVVGFVPAGAGRASPAPPPQCPRPAPPTQLNVVSCALLAWARGWDGRLG